MQAQLADSRASLAAAEHALSNDLVRAPFSGTVYSLPVKPFDFVPAGDELVQLADLSRMQVRAYFDEPEIGKLRVNDAVLITWDAKPALSWHGHIVRTPTSVKVTTQQIYHVLSLPREALHTQGAENFVYLVQGGVLKKRPIQVGALNLMSVQILSGLSLGDTVALTTMNSDTELMDGLHVQVVQQ